MSRSANFFLLFVAPALSLALALLGLETLDQNRMGWFLLAAGIGYPAVAIASYSIHKTPLWAVRGEVVHEEPGIAGGMYRVIVMEKSAVGG